MSASPVKLLAERHGLPVEQPASPGAFDRAGKLDQLDTLVVAAYGLILPESAILRPRLGSINVHLSLLPRWRGAAPVQRAIQAGDETTGVSIMQMDAGLDTGPILMQKSCPIRSDDTAASLSERLLGPARDCLLSVLDALCADGLKPRAQDPSAATYAYRISKREARVDWRRPAREIERMVRAFNPAPVAHAALDGLQVRIWEAEAVDTAPPGSQPGSMLSVSANGIEVATGGGVLRIHRLQLPGKKPISAREFLNAHASRQSPSSAAR